MIMRLVIETDIPPGLELAYKEVIAMNIEKLIDQVVHVVKIETVREAEPEWRRRNG